MTSIPVRVVAALAVIGLAAGPAAAGGATVQAQAQSGAPPTGGHLTVSGDAEVASPWTPAAMRCDAYCYTRARAFFDSVAVFGDDGKVHGMLAESIEPNDDFT